MSRYIDADKLVAWCQRTYQVQSTVGGKAYVSDFLTAVDSCPTADVEEIRHGKSISEKHYSDEFICSECGLIMRECCRYEIDEDADGDESCYGFEFKYCPRCGAKMNIEKEIN